MIDSVSLQDMRHLHLLAGFSEGKQVSDYLCFHARHSDFRHLGPSEAFRFNGLIILLVKGGCVSFSINMEDHLLEKGQMCVVGQNSTIRFDNPDDSNLDAFMLLVSDEFAKDLNFEILVLNQMPITARSSSVFSLGRDDFRLLWHHLSLLEDNSRQNLESDYEVWAKGISRSLLTATLYQSMLTGLRAQTQFASKRSESKCSRKVLYCHEFIRLVRKHFREHHNVAFYARQMCISDRYLSVVIKENTGRSAAAIIDEHIILEAKNLLRFSGKNIQQVSYELNFPTQSSFGKFFKHLTGMSPSQFQNT